MDQGPTGIRQTDFTCVRCGYDLSGATIGGACPECGAPVQETLAARRALKSSSAAITSMVLGIIGLVGCSPVGPIAIVYYFLAMKEINRGGCTPGSRSMALAGLVTGLLSTLLLAVMAAYWIADAM